MKRNFFKILLGALFLPGALWAGATFSRIVTFSDGSILTASDLNGEIDNILNNLTPSGIDDYSATVTQMRSTADPYPGSVESQPTSLAGEIERLRYQILQLLKSFKASDETYWYQDAPTQGAITIDSGNKFVGFNDTTPDGNISIDSSGNGLPASLAFHGGSQNRFWILGSTSTNALFFGQGASGSSQPTATNYAMKLNSDNTVTTSTNTTIGGNLSVTGSGSVTGDLTVTGNLINSGLFTSTGSYPTTSSLSESGYSTVRSVTITTHGRDVLVCAHYSASCANGTGTDSYCRSSMYIKRDSTVLDGSYASQYGYNPAILGGAVSESSCYYDQPGAGTYVYALRVNNDGGVSGTLSAGISAVEVGP